MLQKPLVRDIKNRLNNVKGQVEGIVKMLDQEKDPEQILNQFKAAEKALEKAHFLLMDEVFRKSLAIKLAEALQICPGNCGQEEKLEILRRQFPELDLNELAGKMKEIGDVYDKMRRSRDEY